MDLKNLPWSLAILLAIGCSSDDNGVEEMQEIAAVNFTVIGEDAEKVYQFSYDAEADSSENIDLSAELGISINYLTLRQTGDLLSFYSFSGGTFSLAQRDISNGMVTNFNDFYTNSPGRSVAWGTNNDTNVFFGFFGPNGSRNLAIQDVELGGSETLDVTVDFNIDVVFQPLFFEGKVYFAYRDAQGNNKFTFYDTVTKSVGPLLNFDSISISFLVTDEANIAIVKNGVEATLEIYDADNLTVLEEFSLNFSSGFDPGPVQGAVIESNRLYYAKQFAQPSRFTSGPAVFDLLTQEDEILNIVSIIAEVEQNLGLSLTPTVQVYDASENMFLLGYALLGGEVKGGILQISTDGMLVSNIEFPFFPTFIVQN